MGGAHSALPSAPRVQGGGWRTVARLGHLLIYLFICLTALALSIFFFTLCLYMAVLGLRCCASFSLVSKSGGYSSLRCRGFSCCRALALGHTGPVIAVLELWNTGPVVAAHGLSCSEACGIKPVSPALAGRFRTWDQTCVSCVGRQILDHRATREAPAAGLCCVT